MSLILSKILFIAKIPSQLNFGLQSGYFAERIRRVLPGRLYVGRWNERVRAKRCDAVDWGLLKRGDSKLLTHSNLDV